MLFYFVITFLTVTHLWIYLMAVFLCQYWLIELLFLNIRSSRIGYVRWSRPITFFPPRCIVHESLSLTLEWLIMQITISWRLKGTGEQHFYTLPLKEFSFALPIQRQEVIFFAWPGLINGPSLKFLTVLLRQKEWTKFTWVISDPCTDLVVDTVGPCSFGPTPSTMTQSSYGIFLQGW